MKKRTVISREEEKELTEVTDNWYYNIVIILSVKIRITQGKILLSAGLVAHFAHHWSCTFSLRKCFASFTVTILLLSFNFTFRCHKLALEVQSSVHFTAVQVSLTNTVIVFIFKCPKCGLVRATSSDVMMVDVSQQRGSVMVIMTVGIWVMRIKDIIVVGG